MVPRSISEILAQADELADRFEAFDPDSAKEVPVEVYLLARAALARAQSEQGVLEAVLRARSAGVTWSRIGELLGTSAQAAQQRYGHLGVPR